MSTSGSRHACTIALQCRYVPEYLAVGEAPEQVRNCFQQRSRWCKGHYQVIFSRRHCPLLQRRLSFLMKVRGMLLVAHHPGSHSGVVMFASMQVCMLYSSIDTMHRVAWLHESLCMG